MPVYKLEKFLESVLLMSSGLKNFGLFAGAMAFLACIIGGIFAITGNTNAALGIGIIGFGIFAGASLIIGVLRYGHGAASAKATPAAKTTARPARKTTPAKKTTAPAARTSKPQTAKPVTTKDGQIVLYVGNLPYEAGEKEVRIAFEAFGTVSTVRVVKERSTGRSKGYAFIDMTDASQAQSAVEGMNEREFGGKKLKVSQAKAKSRNNNTSTNNNNTSTNNNGNTNTNSNGNTNPYSRNSNSRKPENPDKREAEMVDWDA